MFLIGANESCGTEPGEQVAVTTIYLDPEYATDPTYCNTDVSACSSRSAARSGILRRAPLKLETAL